MPRTLLITRAAEHAELTQRDVTARGYGTRVDSMLEIVQLPPSAPILGATGAFIITSRNALPGFQAIANKANIPLFIVGKETAALFKQAGFTDIRGIAEQSADLPTLITASLQPNSGALLHITSENAHTDFYDALLDAGFGIEQRLVYRADAAKALQPATLAALKENALSGVLFYSARTAEIFNALIATSALQASLANLHAYCLSDAVGAALHKGEWKAVSIAKSPTHQSLMASL